MADGPDSLAGEPTAGTGAGRAWPAGLIAPSLVLAAICLLLCLWVRPAFVYYRGTPDFPVFRLGGRFAADFLAHPGGLVDYAAAFLSQFFMWHWAAALTTLAVALLLAFGLWAFFRAAFGVRPRWLHLAPVVLVPLLSARYAHHLNGLLAIAVALAAAAVCAGVGRKRPLTGLFLFVVLAVLVYYVACGAVLLFGALCALAALAKGRWTGAAVSCAVVAALPFLLGVTWFRERPHDAWLRLLPLHRYAEPLARELMSALWLYVIAVAVWAAVREARGPVRRGLAARAVPWLAVGVVAVLAIPAGANRAYGRVLGLNYYARNRLWPPVLAAAQQIGPRRYNLIVNLTVNLALYHTGRLNDDMLKFHPTRQSLLRTPEEFIPPVGRPYEGPTPRSFMRLSDIYYDLGRINEAEHMAHEALEAQGDRPWLIERLAVINLAKEKLPAASRFIELLALDPVHRGRARELRALLNDEEEAADDPEIARLRALRPVGPERGDRTLEGMLQELIERSPSNRMAVNYLTAHYLLTVDLPGVVANAGALTALEGGRTPRLCEEALAIYEDLSGPGAGADTHVSAATQARLVAFQNALQAAGGDPREGLRELRPLYGDSYFLYFALHMAGEEQ